MMIIAPTPRFVRHAVARLRAPVSASVSVSAPALTISGRAFFSSASSFSDIPTVTLAYDLHEPAKPVADAKTSPIIFMHGLFGSKKNNRTMSKVLARDLGRHIYALDLRNHGDSPHDQRHDYLAMAADVAEFIRQHNLKEPTLIGHSMGAKTALTLALQDPSLITNLVAVDNAPIDVPLTSDFPRYIQGMKAIDAANVTRQAEADKILTPYESSFTIRQFLLGSLYRPDPKNDQTLKYRLPLGVLGGALGYLGDFPFRNPSERRFVKPALFVRGTKSLYVPDEVIPAIGEFFPRFEMVDVDSGHWVISEKPEAFRETVVNFLEPKE
ncbi:Alpha/Beta hydrolase protein [Chaetomium sp. MPI-SDFR-AT-0129]|nr:Alpha/Beta hydrolase protein [Chaetomium sp. MPI-SDFR-AT-0129]